MHIGKSHLNAKKKVSENAEIKRFEKVLDIPEKDIWFDKYGKILIVKGKTKPYKEILKNCIF